MWVDRVVIAKCMGFESHCGALEDSGALKIASEEAGRNDRCVCVTKVID